MLGRAIKAQVGSPRLIDIASVGASGEVLRLV